MGTFTSDSIATGICRGFYKVLSIAYSIVFHLEDSLYLPCSVATKFHNKTSTPTYHTDPALLMHSTVSAYRQGRPYLSCSV